MCLSFSELGVSHIENVFGMWWHRFIQNGQAHMPQKDVLHGMEKEKNTKALCTGDSRVPFMEKKKVPFELAFVTSGQK